MMIISAIVKPVALSNRKGTDSQNSGLTWCEKYKPKSQVKIRSKLLF